MIEYELITGVLFIVSILLNFHNRNWPYEPVITIGDSRNCFSKCCSSTIEHGCSCGSGTNLCRDSATRNRREGWVKRQAADITPTLSFSQKFDSSFFQDR